MISLGVSTRLPKRAFPAFRGQRQFSSARPTCKEIQEAYILSASRTPTAKVCELEECSGEQFTNFGLPSSMVLLLLYQHLSLALSQLDPP